MMAVDVATEPVFRGEQTQTALYRRLRASQ